MSRLSASVAIAAWPGQAPDLVCRRGAGVHNHRQVVQLLQGNYCAQVQQVAGEGVDAAELLKKFHKG